MAKVRLSLLIVRLAHRVAAVDTTGHARSIVGIILQLELLRVEIEREFPDARSFIRAGFDEVLGDAN